jgi:hypothetical protein
MHGTELRISDCRAYSPQAPRLLAYPASASSPLDAPQLIFPKRDRSLVAAFPSPRTPSACADSTLRSMVLACYFAHLLAVRPARSTFRLPRQGLVGPSFRRHPRLKPVAFCAGPLAGCAARFRSPSGVFAPSGSKHCLASQPFGPPSGTARSSSAPRSLSF